MVKRELKINLKSFLIWTSVILGMFIVVLSIYPSLMNSETMSGIDSMLEMFPEEVLKAFNMDLVEVASISTASGWIKTEGLVFFLLVGSLYASILGGNILLKEESDKTIEFLAVKPITRSGIITSKVISGLIYITAFDLIVSAGTIIGLWLLDDLVLKDMVMLLVGPIIIFYVFFALTLFISTFFSKTKKIVGLSFALVFASYFLQVIGSLSEKVEMVKYFSIFSIYETRTVLVEGSLNYLSIGVGIIIILISTAATYINYNKKELV
ncbi:ABC transporter permease subunit [Alloiococcus sp. CFN-8]|uniref:ABC transporter permease subunit n=1 Tax=Alloiococcus sp. CFN-8 TaxID=3416081 RepID=UPI003CED9D92